MQVADLVRKAIGAASKFYNENKTWIDPLLEKIISHCKSLSNNDKKQIK